MNRNLRQERRDLERRQYAFERSTAETVARIEKSMAEFKSEMAEFKAEVRMYMKNNDATIAELKTQMTEFKEDNKRRDEQFHNLIFNATIAWGVGVVSVIITIILATR